MVIYNFIKYLALLMQVFESPYFLLYQKRN